jgi:hypothetical protein
MFAADGPGYDLLFNQDSFPEMHASVSLEYLKTARKIVSYGLLSVNQEAQGPQSLGQVQTRVQDLVESAGGYRRIYRFPHWLRQGYVEEFYRT